MSMKFPVNLATQPSRKDRPILVASGAVGVFLVVTLMVLVSLALADRRRSADTRGVIQRLDQQLARSAGEQTRLNAVLQRPENAEVLERSLFLNSLLYWKVTREHADDYRWYDFVLNYHEFDSPGCPPHENLPAEDRIAVLDGQQRLTALNIGLRGSYAKGTKHRRVGRAQRCCSVQRMVLRCWCVPARWVQRTGVRSP